MTKVNSLNQSLESSGLDGLNRFKKMSLECSNIVLKNKGKLKAFNDESLPYFTRLAETKQNQVLFHLERYLESLKVTEASAEGFNSSPRALWYAIRAFNLRPPGNLFDEVIEADDVIEIYDAEGFQLWRNFAFLEICSYTIEEIYCLEWWDRYFRRDEDTQVCLTTCASVFDPESPPTFKANIASHYIEERNSEERLLIEATHRWFVRLTDEAGRPAALLATSKAKNCGSVVEVGSPFGSVEKPTEETGATRPHLSLVE